VLPCCLTAELFDADDVDVRSADCGRPHFDDGLAWADMRNRFFFQIELAWSVQTVGLDQTSVK
jgi:hypothetical protein